MKILLIITSLGIGGAQRQVCDLADEFIKAGHQVLLIAMSKDIIVRPQSNKVEIVAFNMAKTLHGFISAYWKARNLIKCFKPDVIHSHMVHANLFARYLRLSVNIPKLICTAHSSNEGGWGRMLAYRLTDSLCDFSTNVSQEAMDISVKRGAVPSQRIAAMYNGIDAKRFSFNLTSRSRMRAELGVGENTPLLLAVGRLSVAKDYPNLLSAFSVLATNLKDVQLAIIGSGEEQDRLTAMVAAQGLKERIHFLGLRRDVSDWMSAADVYVMSSAWEGMPLVLLEAMACKRVVVATDCGGVKEVLGDAGILVPAKNSEALATAINQALSLDPMTAKKIGTQAREYVIRNYSLDAVAAKWIDLYKK